MRHRTPADAHQHQAPTVRKYAAHAMAILEALRLAAGHWYSFRAVLPENGEDKVEADRVNEAMATARERLAAYAVTVALNASLTDERYDANLMEAAQAAEYEPVSQLTAIRQLREESERYHDEAGRADAMFAAADAGGLWQLVEEIGRFVEAKCKPADPLAVAFKKALTFDEGAVPDREALEAAKQMFLALPAQRRRRILNGWTLDPNIPPNLVPDRGAVQQMLHITVPCSKRQRVVALQQWTPRDQVGGLDVDISFGTTKREALDALDRVRAMILDQWDRMVAEDEKFHDERPQRAA